MIYCIVCREVRNVKTGENADWQIKRKTSGATEVFLFMRGR